MNFLAYESKIGIWSIEEMYTHTNIHFIISTLNADESGFSNWSNPLIGYLQ